ncbi:MAG TPA: hypothetical protein ENK56_04240 [Chloroflexi bacterium]|nr:hypothetical protein [Chloroflexota bacterium]
MDLTCVYVAQGLTEAEVIKAKLEANEIPVLLQYESLGPVIGLTLDGLGEVRVMVPIRLATLAQELLEEAPTVE